MARFGEMGHDVPPDEPRRAGYGNLHLGCTPHKEIVVCIDCLGHTHPHRNEQVPKLRQEA